jgi:CspA family cold shock protein
LALTRGPIVECVQTGTVRQWDGDEGWGVLDSAATPGGCWVHFSAIVATGYRTLRAGDEVEFAFAAAEQDGFAFTAEQVWMPGVESGPRAAPSRPSDGAYRSTLTIRYDDGCTETWPG